MIRNTTLALAVSLAFTVAACGGGGGSAPAVAVTPPPPAFAGPWAVGNISKAIASGYGVNLPITGTVDASPVVSSPNVTIAYGGAINGTDGYTSNASAITVDYSTESAPNVSQSIVMPGTLTTNTSNGNAISATLYNGAYGAVNSGASPLLPLSMTASAGIVNSELMSWSDTCDGLVEVFDPSTGSNTLQPTTYACGSDVIALSTALDPNDSTVLLVTFSDTQTLPVEPFSTVSKMVWSVDSHGNVAIVNGSINWVQWATVANPGTFGLSAYGPMQLNQYALIVGHP